MIEVQCCRTGLLKFILSDAADIILNRNAEWDVSLFKQGKLRTGTYCFEAKTTDGFPFNTNAVMVLINGTGGVGYGFNVALLVETNGQNSFGVYANHRRSSSWNAWKAL